MPPTRRGGRLWPPTQNFAAGAPESTCRQCNHSTSKAPTPTGRPPGRNHDAAALAARLEEAGLDIEQALDAAKQARQILAERDRQNREDDLQSDDLMRR